MTPKRWFLAQNVREEVTMWQMRFGTRAQRIVAEFSEEEGISVTVLASKDKSRFISGKRQELFLRLREHTNLSCAQIGKMLGGRDASTVNYGSRMARERRLAQ